MIKIIFIISFLFSPIFSEEESVLNKFEKSLKKESTDSSEYEQSFNESESNHGTENSTNTNCSHSHCNNQCTYYNNKKKRGSFFDIFDNIDLIIDLSKFLYKSVQIIAEPIVTVVSAPLWWPMEMDDYSVEKLSFDKYPFYSTNGMFKINGRQKYVKAEITTLSFDDSIYGNKAKINFQYFGKTGLNYSYVHLKENVNSLLINKYMNSFMINRNFSVNNSFLQKHSIDFSWGIGYSNWISSEYENSGLKIEYGIRTFIKPFSINCNLGYSNIGNGLYDINAGISYHYKRFSFNLGLQNYKTDSAKIGGTTYSLSYWF